jgi:hypothetical protein
MSRLLLGSYYNLLVLFQKNSLRKRLEAAQTLVARNNLTLMNGSVLISCRSITTVVVEGEEFQVCTDLLILNSTFFANRLCCHGKAQTKSLPYASSNSPEIKIKQEHMRDKCWEEGMEHELLYVPSLSSAGSSDLSALPPRGPDDKITLLNVKRSDFVNFLSWVYSGQLTDAVAEFYPKEEKVLHTPRLWVLGDMLGSPSFKNFSIEQLRYDCWEEVTLRNNLWPTPLQARDIYRITSAHAIVAEGIKGDQAAGQNQLRKFTAGVIAVIHPLGRFQESDEMYVEWMKVVQEVPDIGNDIFRAGNECWINVKPWAMGLFTVEEKGIRERWKELVVGRRSTGDGPKFMESAQIVLESMACV